MLEKWKLPIKRKEKTKRVGRKRERKSVLNRIERMFYLFRKNVYLIDGTERKMEINENRSRKINKIGAEEKNVEELERLRCVETL